MPGKSITKRARAEFDPAQAALIRSTVARDCNENEFHLFLEIAAHHDLNPLTGEIYAAKFASKNGGGGRVVMFVGRNGWLKMARRNEDFVSVESEVVREADTFRVKRNPDGSRDIVHEYEGVDRGLIKGAYAVLHRRDLPDAYFFAPIDEYKPTSPAKLEHSPWSTQESVMMKKCAIVPLLRETYELSGLYDEAEMAKMSEQGGAPVEAAIDYGDDLIGTRLRLLIETATEIDPTMYRSAKVRLRLTGASDEQREAFCHEVADFIASRDGELPDLPDADAEAEEVEAQAA